MINDINELWAYAINLVLDLECFDQSSPKVTDALYRVDCWLPSQEALTARLERIQYDKRGQLKLRTEIRKGITILFGGYQHALSMPERCRHCGADNMQGILSYDCLFCVDHEILPTEYRESSRAPSADLCARCANPVWQECGCYPDDPDLDLERIAAMEPMPMLEPCPVCHKIDASNYLDNDCVWC